MAGGINLPSIGVGVGPVTGIGTFAPTEMDPFTTMLRAYGMGQQGQAQGLEALTSAKKLPFIEQGMQADIAQALSTANQRNQEAALNEWIVNSLKRNAPSLSSGAAGMGATMPQYGGAASPSQSSQSNGVLGYSPGDFATALMRKRLGLDEESPEQKMDREIRTYRDKENIKHQIEEERGTTSTKSTRQQRSLGIKSVEPILDELSKIEVPPQWLLNDNPMNPANWIYGNAQSTYEGEMGLAVDSLMTAYNLPKNIPIIETVKKIAGRGKFESDKNYKGRVKKAMEHLQQQYGIINPGENQESNKTNYVRMIGPDGGVYDVPEGDVEAALRSGGRYE